MKKTRKNKNGVLLIGVGVFLSIILSLMVFITMMQEASYKNYASEASDTIRKEVYNRYNIKEDFYDEYNNLNTKLLDFNFKIKEQYLQYINTVQVTENVVSVDFIVDGNYYEFEFAKQNDGKVKLNYAVENGELYNEELVNKFFVI